MEWPSFKSSIPRTLLLCQGQRKLLQEGTLIPPLDSKLSFAINYTGPSAVPRINHKHTASTAPRGQGHLALFLGELDIFHLKSLQGDYWTQRSTPALPHNLKIKVSNKTQGVLLVTPKR